MNKKRQPKVREISKHITSDNQKTTLLLSSQQKITVLCFNVFCAIIVFIKDRDNISNQ